MLLFTSRTIQSRTVNKMGENRPKLLKIIYLFDCCCERFHLQSWRSAHDDPQRRTLLPTVTNFGLTLKQSSVQRMGVRNCQKGRVLVCYMRVSYNLCPFSVPRWKILAKVKVFRQVALFILFSSNPNWSVTEQVKLSWNKISFFSID